jgi:homoserine kinase type II
MPEHTSSDWSLEELESLLAGYDIAGQVTGAEVLAGGVDNLNLLVTIDGQRLVLRRYDITPDEEVDFELTLIRFLTERRFPTAPVLLRPDGAPKAAFMGRPAALFRFVPGTHPRPDSPEAGLRVAEVIADLHLVTRGLKLRRLRSRTDMGRLRRLEEVALYHGIFTADLVELLRQVRELREEYIARVVARDEGMLRGVVYHDPNPSNILLDERGAVVALLDFDEAHIAYLIMDLASLVMYWARTADHGVDPRRAAQLFTAYHRRRPLLDMEREMLPDSLLLLFLADAAEYVTGALERDPTSNPVPECHSYQAYTMLQANTAWREEISAFT